MLFVLAGLAVILTCLMFTTRRMELGYPSAMFWAIFGAYNFMLSGTPWGDIYFYVFIASSLGMTIFCILIAFGLRTRKDTASDTDDNQWADNEPYIDEQGGNGHSELFSIDDNGMKPSKRTKELRKRAEGRRTGEYPSKKREVW